MGIAVLGSARMRAKVWSALALVLLLGACETETAKRADPSTSEEAPADEAETFRLGDAVELGNFRVTAYKVLDPMKPAEYFEPGKNKKFVAVDLEVENTGGEPEPFSILLSVTLKDDDNREYVPDLANGGKTPGAPDGEIAPNDGKRGWVVFEVPKSLDDYRLVFEGDVFASGQAIIELT